MRHRSPPSTPPPRRTPATGDARAEAIWHEEKALLARMDEVAAAARGFPDAKTRHLIGWIREHLCPGLPPWGERPRHDDGPPPRWNERRVLIFTENVVGTKRHLREMLEQVIAGTDRAEERIETIDGQTVGAKRKESQRRFNTDPARDPLRILIATDAAREGLNFQAHCTDLFHFDLPWNPGRIEQRNGRIDRKLQPAPRVRCHYFVLPQREEDRVLEVLVRKTETIKRELGSLSKVIDDDIERRLRSGGIRHRDAERLAREIEAADLDREKKRVATEGARSRARTAGGPQGADRALPRAARTFAALGAVRGGTVPRRDVLLPGADRRGSVAGRPHRGTAARSGHFHRSTAGRGRMRAGPPPWTPSARPERRARSSPSGGGKHRFGRSYSRTPGCSPTTPCICTSSSGWRSACSRDSAPRGSSTTISPAPAWCRPPIPSPA